MIYKITNEDLCSLKKILQEYVSTGNNASDGEWSIAPGKYDLEFELYHNKLPIIGCVDNKVQSYINDYYDNVCEFIAKELHCENENEIVEAGITFTIKTKKKHLGELQRIVDHHLDYMINFEEYPEILTYYDSHLEEL